MDGAPQADRVVDARGSYCPGPLMELIKSIQEEKVGSVLDLLSSDKDSARDVAAWAAKVGHEFVGSREEEGTFHIVVRKTR